MEALIYNPAEDRLKAFTRLMALASGLYHANPRNPPKNMNIADADVLQLLTSLNRHRVRFLLVGGMAGVVHGHIRTTQDMDLWIRSDDETKTGLIRALQENDVAGAEHLSNVPLLFGWTTVAVGKYGFTLDMGYTLTAFRDTDFDACYDRALDVTFESVAFKVIRLADLITEKKATGRDKDKLDVSELQRISHQQDHN